MNRLEELLSLDPRNDVSRETILKIEAFENLLREENARQNLVSAASLDEFWARHILDSAQLTYWSAPDATWIDLGSGAGFPGLVTSLLRRSMTILVDERRLRCAFLERAAHILRIEGHTQILCSRVETAPPGQYDVISARAFAPLDRLFALGERFSHPRTRWILPKGRKAKSELEAALASWQGEFRLEPSRTDAEAWIVVAEKVRRKPQGKTRP